MRGNRGGHWRGNGTGRGGPRISEPEPDLAGNAAVSQRRTQKFGTTETETTERYDPSVAVVGTCQQHEKPYYRLTTKPNPSIIRPQSVLEDWLPILTKRYEEGNCDYNYVSDQLRSIRQDLTVQHIKNQFIAKVYLLHIKLAARHDDLSELMVCLVCLENLNEDRILKEKQALKVFALRILVSLLQEDRETLVQITSHLRPHHLQDRYVQFSMQVLQSLNGCRNYYRFAQLSTSTPSPVTLYLMEKMADKFVRKDALRFMCKAYRPTLAIDFITSQMCFRDVKQCTDFIQACGAVVDSTGAYLMCKESKVV
ncbi:SAC3/GANP family protein [Planoprotostelium fungivorum]|uniref:SAC3/GANP family protein n=1 Tax=Planoprotostelium fungivorum TaxID=1890364 RepID=A0A2P6NDJ6_9EUKA|nr:SAC3/GANP family protein [Planoprotostelium fungivorum]